MEAQPRDVQWLDAKGGEGERGSSEVLAIEVHGNLDGPKEQGDDEEGLDEGVEPGATTGLFPLHLKF
jgi:hypothetical protein